MQGGVWRRKGWAAMDSLRERLEVLKELRDLVRSLGRGGGWGPLRRAPMQAHGPPFERSNSHLAVSPCALAASSEPLQGSAGKRSSCVAHACMHPHGLR